MDKEKVLEQIRGVFDVPVMQNNFRGLWVELMISELLGPDWKQVGNDWSAWDIEREDGLKIEVKQSARSQSWGKSSTSPRFIISAPTGHFSNGNTWVPNPSGKRLAEIYIFAWHEENDQRIASEWQFYVVPSHKLPNHQKTIGLKPIQALSPAISALELSRHVKLVAD